MIADTKQYETNKITKKQSKMNLTLMICYIQIKVLTLISSSAFNTENFMKQILQQLSNGTIQIFPAYAVACHSNMYMSYKWVNIK